MRENGSLTDAPSEAPAPNAADASYPITWRQFLDMLAQIGHQELGRRRAIEKAMGLPASEIARSHYRYALARLARVSEVDQFWANAAQALKTYREATHLLLNAVEKLRGRPAQDDEALAGLVAGIKRTEKEMRRAAGRTIPRKQPGELALECFRMHAIRRMRHGEIAAALNPGRVRQIPEWRISQWVKQVADWIMGDNAPSPDDSFE